MTEPLTHKERTRARILDEAASAMRLSGTEGIGVANLMKRAGLTQGGFYAHFSSRDDLVTHAVDRMFDDSKALIARYLEGAEPRAGLSALIDAYLSDRARLAPDRTCPIPSISGEATRLPTSARERFNEGVARFEAAIASRLEQLGSPEPEAIANAMLAEMVGAMTMARAACDETTASARLATARASLKARLPAQGGNPVSESSDIVGGRHAKARS